VTPAAVYRHFEGREDLIAECARQGHEIFADLMEVAFNAANPRRWRPSRRRGAPISPSRANIPAITWRCSKAAPRPTRRRSWRGGGQVAHGAGKRGRGAVGAYPARKTPAADDVLGPYLGDEPRGGGAFRARPPGANTPFPPEDLLEAGIGIYLRGLGLIPPDE
jgi:AcrR family transcriptional regulator